MRTGADALWQALASRGVQHALGVPGTQNVALWEALRRSRIRPILTTHELAAAFMANGYVRASGRLAPLVTIPGPGFTYALTGLAEALHDSAALLHLVGAPPPPGPRFRFQSIDQRAVAAPLAKAVMRVEDPSRAAAAAGEAADLALAGEPGPVVLEWTPAALDGPAAGDPGDFRPAAAPALDGAAVERIAAFLAASRRPLILAGQGCAGAAVELRELAELLRAPVVTTTSGRGVLPEDHPLALGFEFVRGDLPALNELARACDAVLAVGCKLSEAGTTMFALELPPDRLVQIDAAAEIVGANYPARIGLAARAEDALVRLLPALRAARQRGGGFGPEDLEAWRSRLRVQVQGQGDEPRIRGVRPETPAGFGAALRKALPHDAIVVTDSGLHQTLIRRHVPILAPRGLLVPSDFQSMGFGLPAAIGAKLAAPGRTVVAVIGDGGFAMSGLELLTAVREGLSLTVLVFNDGQLNRIRLQQLSQYGHPVAVELRNPDFEAFAAAVGARYARVEGDAEAILREAVGCEGVTLVEVALEDARTLVIERAKGMARGALRRAAPPGPLRLLRAALRREHGRG